MMAGNPNWRSMHPHPHFVFGTSNSNPSPPSDLHHDLPVRSWSHLLLGGLRGNEEESLFQQQKKLEDEELNLNPSFSTIYVDVKQESIYGQLVDDQFQNQVSKSHHHPQSLFNFSSKDSKNHHHIQDHSSQGTRWERKNGGVTKKAKVQQSAQPALKVRKEKLGDRITALHQLVSPFGKTDTASVLSEAIGYIRFLQCQVETLSSSYMRNGAENTIHQQHSVQEKNCLCIQEPSQFLNDIAMEGTGASQQDSLGLSDLRSRGLCLVPISCTLHVGNDNGADYWAPAAFGGGISFSG